MITKLDHDVPAPYFYGSVSVWALFSSLRICGLTATVRRTADASRCEVDVEVEDLHGSFFPPRWMWRYSTSADASRHELTVALAAVDDMAGFAGTACDVISFIPIKLIVYCT